MSGITTHVLDTAAGHPAAGVGVTLELQMSDGGWEWLAAGVTDADGRLANMLPQDRTLVRGVYRLVFDTADYLEAGFYPHVAVAFDVTDPGEHYHVPLLLSPYGYSTYRGT